MWWCARPNWYFSYLIYVFQLVSSHFHVVVSTYLVIYFNYHYVYSVSYPYYEFRMKKMWFTFNVHVLLIDRTRRQLSVSGVLSKRHLAKVLGYSSRCLPQFYFGSGKVFQMHSFVVKISYSFFLHPFRRINFETVLSVSKKKAVKNNWKTIYSILYSFLPAKMYGKACI